MTTQLEIEAAARAICNAQNYCFSPEERENELVASHPYYEDSAKAALIAAEKVRGDGVFDAKTSALEEGHEYMVWRSQDKGWWWGVYIQGEWFVKYGNDRLWVKDVTHFRVIPPAPTAPKMGV